ncbi:MAG: hypothetical protein LBO69_04875 [Ignavibacteria bacterium]|jgi:hypothetical protein|nr:hypothetical protein [Ignavibacteria bacterium]
MDTQTKGPSPEQIAKITGIVKSVMCGVNKTSKNIANNIASGKPEGFDEQRDKVAPIVKDIIAKIQAGGEDAKPYLKMAERWQSSTANGACIGSNVSNVKCGYAKVAPIICDVIRRINSGEIDINKFKP